MKIYCKGTEGAGGHPKVYLKVAENGEAICPYCGRRFVATQGASGKSVRSVGSHTDRQADSSAPLSNSNGK